MDRHFLKGKRVGSRVAACAVIGFSIVGCQQILGIHARSEKSHLECTNESCLCETGFLDCNATENDGCEINGNNDQNNCGACGVVCANASCVAGACGCIDGFADCDEQVANGCETELANTSTSCGACGHDCQGGSCAGGLCVPQVIAAATTPSALVLRGSIFYFLAGEDAVRVPITGGTPEKLVTTGDANALSANDTFLGVLSSDSVSVLDLSNNHLTKIYSDPQADLVEIAVVGDSIYVAREVDSGRTGTRSLLSIDKTTGVATTITDDLDTVLEAALVPFDGVLYWKTASNTIETLNAGVVEPWASAPSTDVDQFAISTTNLFVLSYSTAALLRIPLAGGPTASVPISVPDEIGAFGEAAYWSDTDSQTLYGWDGSAPMATTVTSTGDFTFPARVIVDDKSLYWLSNAGLTKIAR
jgi:hypothetical protein